MNNIESNGEPVGSPKVDLNDHGRRRGDRRKAQHALDHEDRRTGERRSNPDRRTTRRRSTD